MVSNFFNGGEVLLRFAEGGRCSQHAVLLAGLVLGQEDGRQLGLLRVQQTLLAQTAGAPVHAGGVLKVAVKCVVFAVLDFKLSNASLIRFILVSFVLELR